MLNYKARGLDTSDLRSQILQIQFENYKMEKEGVVVGLEFKELLSRKKEIEKMLRLLLIKKKNSLIKKRICELDDELKCIENTLLELEEG